MARNGIPPTQRFEKLFDGKYKSFSCECRDFSCSCSYSHEMMMVLFVDNLFTDVSTRESNRNVGKIGFL